MTLRDFSKPDQEFGVLKWDDGLLEGQWLDQNMGEYNLSLKRPFLIDCCCCDWLGQSSQVKVTKVIKITLTCKVFNKFKVLHSRSHSTFRTALVGTMVWYILDFSPHPHIQDRGSYSLSYQCYCLLMALGEPLPQELPLAQGSCPTQVCPCPKDIRHPMTFWWTTEQQRPRPLGSMQTILKGYSRSRDSPRGLGRASVATSLMFNFFLCSILFSLYPLSIQTLSTNISNRIPVCKSPSQNCLPGNPI